MQKHYYAFLVSLWLYNSANAETIDIRYLVADDLGSTPTAQQTVTASLSRYTEELNQYYRNSKVHLTAHMLNVTFVPIDELEAEDILDDMQHENAGFADLFSTAHQIGADYTFAVTKELLIRGQARCGRAFAVNQTLPAISSTRSAFAVVNFACGAHTIAHELGHLMGLNHGALVDQCQPNHGHTAALTPYATGYGKGNCDRQYQKGEFGDIMVGGWMDTISGKGKKNLPLYSNPLLKDARCGTQQICGDPTIGDAARTLNEYAKYYAGHENR